VTSEQSHILRVATSVGALSVHTAGPLDGPTALLWPSLFTDGHTSWGLQLEALHRLGWRTLLVDPWSTGDSEAPTAGFTMEDCGEAALRVLDAGGVQRAALLGLSWGGFVALRVALSAPERVTALVLSNTSARAATPLKRNRDRALAKLVRLGIPGGAGKLVAAAMISEHSKTHRPPLAAEIAAGVDRLDRIALSTAMRSVLAERSDVSARLTEVAVPALVIDGAADSQFSRAHSQELAKKIPYARLYVLPDVGHLAPREADTTVTELIEAFVSEVQPR
jgi:3-oxoadipate enol-lactonase